MDLNRYNRFAWDEAVEAGNVWTVPVDREAIEKAKQGYFDLRLTPSRPVPRTWFPEINGAEVLCLAAGGGQQGPILAAAGATVTLLDASFRQLGQDAHVCLREQLGMQLALGDMRFLPFRNHSFDLIVHPCSNMFVPEVAPVWQEAFRVLRPGGLLLSGFENPALYLFDAPYSAGSPPVVRFQLPYSDLLSLSETERKELLLRKEPLQFSHSLEELIGGQAQAGFMITGLYEDVDPSMALCRWLPCFIATRAVKP